MTELHENDRNELAKALGLTLEKFDNLVAQGNKAYEFIKTHGPFYGRESINEPTFRITAKPLTLPRVFKEKLTSFGNDLIYLGKALAKLPEEHKNKLGSDLVFSLPPTWRIDVIVASAEKIHVNEIEGIDSVSALMQAEQQAYALQNPEESTVSRLIHVLRQMCGNEEKLNLAIIRNDLEHNPFTPNARRLIESFAEKSHGTIKIELFDLDELKNNVTKPNWDDYTGVINEAYASPADLKSFGIRKEQILAAGNYNAIVNKGVFALVFDKNLESFWQTELGEERLARLQEILIPSYFVRTKEELQQARKDGKVVKITWAEGNQIIINRCKGVATPGGEIEESTDKRWNMIEEAIEKGYTVIAQDFIIPTKLHAYLRKRGTNLEEVNWYNRICIKYVCNANPQDETPTTVSMTAIEATLGPEVIPAGRKCAFTAATFEK